MNPEPTSHPVLGKILPGQIIRSVLCDGQEWFFAFDICRALGLKRGDTSVFKLPAAWRKTLRFCSADFGQSGRGSNLRRDFTGILLAGVVWLAARSHKANAAERVASALAPMLAEFAKHGVLVAGDTPAERCRLLSKRLARECRKLKRPIR